MSKKVTKTCNSCHRIKNRKAGFYNYVYPPVKPGYGPKRWTSSKCRACVAKRTRVYQKTKRGRLIQKKCIRNWKRNHHETAVAMLKRNAAKRAARIKEEIKLGILKYERQCPLCDKTIIYTTEGGYNSGKRFNSPCRVHHSITIPTALSESDIENIKIQRAAGDSLQTLTHRWHISTIRLKTITGEK